MMTIGQFSERTGLRPKTLRYYEEVDLLTPAVRLDNGYRQYSDAQVEQAHLISSLRQAGVSVAGIRDFLAAAPARREELLARWREEAATKLLSIQVANQFLSGLDAHTKHVHLVHWDQPRKMTWFSTAAQTSAAEWKVSAQRHQRQLVASGVVVERSCYVRFPDGEEGTQGEIGFVIQDKNPPAGLKVEEYAPTLFAALECHATMSLHCKPIFSAIRRSGFRPTGTPLRKYPEVSSFIEGHYLLMLPVAHF